VSFRDRLDLDIADTELEGDLPPYHHPGASSDELAYLHSPRHELGGYLPERRVHARGVDLPSDETYADLKAGSGNQEVATTMAAVRQVRDLLRQPDVGPRLVPIIPDEARTFGMDALFREIKIYSPHGQRYEPVDQQMLPAYLEATNGQILDEDITEDGAMGSFHAAGTSYATHGEPMLPIYVFYSMFGFQRTGDQIWSATDQLARGFLFGATAGRTTLVGEGAQHNDGHSLLLAATNPAVKTYDASFAYELAVYLRDGVERMLPTHDSPGENIIYYLTMYNEPIPQPPMPEHVTEDDVRRGLYRYAEAPDGHPHRVRILASGAAMTEALRAVNLLADHWDIGAELWSVPGWVGLHRDGLAADEHNLLHPDATPRKPVVAQQLGDTSTPIVAVTDYQRAVPQLISPWLAATSSTLGTDGFGLSDTRPALRRHFHVDAEHITLAALTALARDRTIDPSIPAKSASHHQLTDHTDRPN
jgi:pyruvate dehydrogenase E1 component